MIITIDGVRTTTYVSCHWDDSFSYHNGKDWVRKAKTVPRAVLEDLPEGERVRVQRKLAELGRSPS